MAEEDTREPNDVVEESMNDVPPTEDPDDLFLSPEDSDAEEVDEITAKITGLEESVTALTEERDDFKNRMIRAAADLDNFRKRSNREKEELRRYGIDKVVGELIPVVDNFERALQHTEANEANKSLLDGVQMIYRQFVTALNKHGVEGFESVGEPFDPQQHEAIQQVESADYPAGTVVDQFQKGYFLHDRLIRPALVSVSMRPQGEVVAEEPPSEEPEDPSVEGSIEASPEASTAEPGEVTAVADAESEALDEPEEVPVEPTHEPEDPSAEEPSEDE